MKFYQYKTIKEIVIQNLKCKVLYFPFLLVCIYWETVSGMRIFRHLADFRFFDNSGNFRFFVFSSRNSAFFFFLFFPKIPLLSSNFRRKFSKDRTAQLFHSGIQLIHLLMNHTTRKYSEFSEHRKGGNISLLCCNGQWQPCF